MLCSKLQDWEDDLRDGSGWLEGMDRVVWRWCSYDLVWGGVKYMGLRGDTGTLETEGGRQLGCRCAGNSCVRRGSGYGGGEVFGDTGGVRWGSYVFYSDRVMEAMLARSGTLAGGRVRANLLQRWGLCRGQEGCGNRREAGKRMVDSDVDTSEYA